RDEIERYGYVTVADLLRHTPGFFHTYDYDEDLIGIRGILGGEIAVLVNGVLQPTSQLKHIAFPVEWIARVEITRGPMSVMYGNGAFLGAINFITFDSKHPIRNHRASLTYGSRNTYKLTVGAQAAEDTMRAMVAASIYATDGLDVSYADLMGPDQLAAVPERSHSSTGGDLERANRSALFAYERDGLYGQFRYNETVNEWYVVTPAFDDGNREDTEVTTMTLGYKFRPLETLTVHPSVTYSYFHERRTYDFVVPGLVGHRDHEWKWFMPEIAINFFPTSSLQALLGVNVMATLDGTYALSVPELGLDVTIEDEPIVTRSIFGQVNYTPFEMVKLTAGLRLEQSLSYETHRTGRDDTPSGVATIYADEEIYFSPRLASMFFPGEQHSLRLFYGGANRNRPVIDAEVEEFRERTTIESLEFAYVLSLPRLTANLSVFRSEVDHLQRFFQEFVDGELQTIFDSSGELLTAGAEVVVQYRPFSRLTFEASTTYSSVKDESNEVEVGNRPRLLAKAKATYSIWHMTLALLGTFTDGMLADWNVIDPAGVEQRLGAPVGSYFLLAGNLRYRHPETGLTASIMLDNVLDADVRYPASSDTPFEQGLLGPGRSVFLSVGHER
ncbi:MAG: TonB-dependent receptor, partial [Myxococcales bacterium]|nr:TonB-dependent receptor [Myxococcales bacterium]